VAFLSTAGIPPLSGFWSKLVIVIALWQSGHYNYAALAIVASVITLAYFLVMQRKVFFGNVGEGMEGIKEAGMSLIIPSIILAVITIGVGVFFPFLISTIILPIGKIL
jgi:multicomponent Na+:H+ antiporter subunit D